MNEIPINEYLAVGADERMPWVYETGIGDPIVYGERGKGAVRWAIHQQVRRMVPSKCTHCWQAATARGEPAPQEHLGLVSVLHPRSSAKSPTEWVTYCVDHFDQAVKNGKIL